MFNKFQPYLYIILILYIIAGIFYPAIGVLAIVCMLAPVFMAIFKGRHWCGNYCPRGSFYDSIIKKLSPRKSIPSFFRTLRFRLFMLGVIMSVFGFQMYFAWGNINAMGLVFLRIIFITTIVGILLGIVFHERTWCTFCPMGTMASWLSNRTNPITVSSSCKSCSLCQKVCPMQLNPSTGKSTSEFNHPDCLKCGRCIEKCPVKALSFSQSTSCSNCKVD